MDKHNPFSSIRLRCLFLMLIIQFQLPENSSAASMGFYDVYYYDCADRDCSEENSVEDPDDYGTDYENPGNDEDCENADESPRKDEDYETDYLNPGDNEDCDNDSLNPGEDETDYQSPESKEEGETGKPEDNEDWDEDNSKLRGDEGSEKPDYQSPESNEEGGMDSSRNDEDYDDDNGKPNYRKWASGLAESRVEPGWTIIQRRTGPKLNFYRGWAEYENGFGNKDDDLWLGNTQIHAITRDRKFTFTLRVELTDWDGIVCHAQYSDFRLGGPDTKYKLESLGEYTGDCGNSMSYHLGKKFTTFDKDNDANSGNCAKKHHGAWWYHNCHVSNLNGAYKMTRKVNEKRADAICWHSKGGYGESFKETLMKIRPN